MFRIKKIRSISLEEGFCNVGFEPIDVSFSDFH